MFTASDVSPGAQNTHLQGLSAILTAAGSPFDLLGGLRVFSMANALPIKLSDPVNTVPIPESVRELTTEPSNMSFAALLEPPTPTPVHSLDASMCKLNPVLAKSERMLSPAFQDTEALHAYFTQVSNLEQEFETWRNRQVSEWQPHRLLNPILSRCCLGKLELWPGDMETHYDCKLDHARGSTLSIGR